MERWLQIALQTSLLRTGSKVARRIATGRMLLSRRDSARRLGAVDCLLTLAAREASLDVQAALVERRLALSAAVGAVAVDHTPARRAVL